MKRCFMGLIACILMLLFSVYFFIPDYVLLSSNTFVIATKEGLYRNLTGEENWTKWWPGKYLNQINPQAHRKFLFDNYGFQIEGIQINSLDISANKSNTEIKTSLHVFPSVSDSVKLLWEGVIHTSFNPLTRLQRYITAKELNKDMNIIIDKMRSYLSKNENIYGINIRKEHVSDSILIFKIATSKGLPETDFIYHNLNDLKTYIAGNSAHETGFPMLNIYTADSINYVVKVAIPVDKRLTSSGDISQRWMLGGGNILAADVKGGYNSVNTAFKQLENYVNDHHYIAPAIPFQSLITNRSKERDSSKWITRIYYPIMYF